MNRIQHVRRFSRIFQWFFNLNLRNKLLFTYILVAVIPISLIGIVSYSISSHILISQTDKNASLVLSQISSNLDSYGDQFNKTTYTAFTNLSIQKILQQSGPQTIEQQQDNRDIMREYILGINIIDKYINGIYIFSANDESFCENSDGMLPEYNVKNESWYQQIASLSVHQMFVPPHVEKKYINGSRQVNFSYVRALTNIYTGQFLGVLVIDLNEQALTNIIKTTKDKTMGEIYITDSQNQVIFRETGQSGPSASDGLRVGQTFDMSRISSKFRQDNFLLSKYSNQTGWNIIYIVPKSQLYVPVNNIRNATLLIILICSLLFISLSYFISRNLSKPVQRLQQSIRAIEDGDLNVRVKIESNDEIGQLSASFNHMVRNINNLIHDVYEFELKNKQAELNVLQNQINPHFIYNTLETFNMMAILKENYEMSDALTAFSRILRFNFQNKEEIVPIDKELSYLTDYVNLQKLRYTSQFDVTMAADDPVRQYGIIKMIIQPLVENSIYYGFDDTIEKIHIQVSIQKQESSLLITVSDNGIGMTPEKLEDVKKSLHTEEASMKSGSIGLNNINERVKLYFGNEYGLTISSVYGSGTDVRIVIPAVPYSPEKPRRNPGNEPEKYYPEYREN